MDVTGYTESYHAVAGNVKAYGGEGNQEISLSRISKGDKVSIVRVAQNAERGFRPGEI